MYLFKLEGCICLNWKIVDFSSVDRSGAASSHTVDLLCVYGGIIVEFLASKFLFTVFMSSVCFLYSYSYADGPLIVMWTMFNAYETVGRYCTWVSTVTI